MLIKKVEQLKLAQTNNCIVNLEVDIKPSSDILIYPKSVLKYKNSLIAISKIDNIKCLLFIGSKNEFDEFGLEYEKEFSTKYPEQIFSCALSTQNRKILQSKFNFLIPKLCGVENSFGFGDRLGVANTGHIKALENSTFFPILAQQSIRELTRTKRTPDDVMDAAVWAVVQEGYSKGFGADADHLKTEEDIDLMINAGYTMFTIDPGDFVDNEVDNYNSEELDNKFSLLPWHNLQETAENAFNRYASEIKIVDGFVLSPDAVNLKKAYVKYGNALLQVKKLHDHLANKYSNLPSEIEVSVDETESVTTPFEHFFIVNELNRLGVKFISIAPRFIGDFEKGIDYKGDLGLFKEEYLKHIAITKYFGNYKISLHSGSDKFGVYKVIGEIDNAYTHVKTAGTSYLEALRVVAQVDSKFFGKIFDYCLDLYENEKKTYHVSADINQLSKSAKYTDMELRELLDNIHARQVLHVTYGRVLTDQDQNGKYLFKTNLMNILYQNEDLYDKYLVKHFKKHIEPFGF